MVANLILIFYFSTLSLEIMKSYHVLGLMSGTSLDGLDIAHVRIRRSGETWAFELLHAETIPLDGEINKQLALAKTFSSYEFCRLDLDLALFFAAQVNVFLDKHQINRQDIDLIASHGQTIFHQPENGMTVQIGCGATLAKHTGISVVSDFRKKDVLAGGQGAPLVPIGDFSLFKAEADCFLNIGGIANLSYKDQGVIRAYDICSGNLPLNRLAGKMGLHFDSNGDLARAGTLNKSIFEQLNALPYFMLPAPKSLGTEWLDAHVYPLIDQESTQDMLHTVIEHEAFQISLALRQAKADSVLITGGGAFNTYLIERITHYYSGKIVRPENDIIDYKEAIIFAFLGVLNLEGKANCLASVTGANRDVCGGILYLP